MLPFLHGRKLVYTHPGDGFTILMQTAIIVGIVFALPVIIYQVWAFLSPALHRHEKRVAIPVIVGAVFLFICRRGARVVLRAADDAAVPHSASATTPSTR